MIDVIRWQLIVKSLAVGIKTHIECSMQKSGVQQRMKKKQRAISVGIF